MTIRPDQKYPLTWPEGWKRTPTYQRGPSPFKTTPDKALQDLLEELGRLGAKNVLISSNLMLRGDGFPYAKQPKTDDQGIAVYFTRKGKEMVLACDKFARREDNMRAISKTIEAIRGIERWGSSDMMERAFTGFTQLEHNPGPKWWEELGVPEDAAQSTVEAAYRWLRGKYHPDREGGSVDAFQRIQNAWDQYNQRPAR